MQVKTKHLHENKSSKYSVKCNSDITLPTTGVKQGGILSPMLFNVYMDGLSIKLNQSGIGGVIGGHSIIYVTPMTCFN